MTAPFDTDTCDSEAARLLPWFVTGRLPAEDAARVEEHLADCPVCRADLAVQRDLRSLMRSDERIEYAPQPSLQKLMTRIDEMDREIPEVALVRPGDEPSVPRARVPHWMVAAVVLQTVGLGLLGALLWDRGPSRGDPARYVTLATPAPAADEAQRLRVVFAPETTANEMGLMLGALQAAVVDGPTEAGAYTIALRSGGRDAPSVDASLARLRANPHVLFAEPVAGSGSPR